MHEGDRDALPGPWGWETAGVKRVADVWWRLLADMWWSGVEAARLLKPFHGGKKRSTVVEKLVPALGGSQRPA
jgi:hypothetical protein